MTADPVSGFMPGSTVERPHLRKGPLADTGFAVKDLFDICGHVSSCGNPDWLRTHEPAKSDAPAIRHLREAGADLLGVTIMDELAYSLAGSNAHYGTPINPAAPGRVCGGSSSGSASVVAAGACDFALGTDTAGSVRVPASYCGLFGMRPSHGRIRLEGLMPLAPSFDSIGWLARDPDLLVHVGEVLLGSRIERVSRPQRLLLAQDAFDLLDDEAREALEDAARKLSDRWSRPLETVRLSSGDCDLGRWSRTFIRLQAREVWHAHGRWVLTHAPRFGPGVAERFERARALAAEDGGREEDQATRENVCATFQALLPAGTVLLLPSAAGAAPTIAAPADATQRLRALTLQLSTAAPMARLPQVSLPLARVDGRPLGLSLAAAAGADELLLGLTPASVAH